MSDNLLEATMREGSGKGPSHRSRMKGMIPAVLYGKGQENLHIEVNPLKLEKIVHSKLGMNTLIRLQVAQKGEFNVLLKHYQAHAIKRNFTHADFYKVDAGQRIQVRVPIHLTGRAAGLKEGGILEQIARELTVSCLPTNIPESIDVDVTEMAIGVTLHLSDLKLPEGVIAVDKTNLSIVSIVAPREEAEPVAEVAQPAEPEVLTGAKDKEAGAEEGGVAKAPAEGKKAEPKK